MGDYFILASSIEISFCTYVDIPTKKKTRGIYILTLVNSSHLGKGVTCYLVNVSFCNMIILAEGSCG